jgi:hypothetical protein
LWAKSNNGGAVVTREELLRALNEPWRYNEPYDLIESAREQIEADGKRIAELEAENARLRDVLANMQEGD